MDDNKTVQVLSRVKAFGDVPTLGRIRELSRRLGDPWKFLKCFHVAGTNGKGSVSSYLTHILCTAGYRVGWYTSPYLERFSERIRVLDGVDELAQYDEDNQKGEISEKDISRLFSKIQDVVDAMQADGYDLPTEFDIITATAFIYFKEKNCDFVVLETGLGGRIDSTNVIEQPLANILTAPGFDHTAQLGNTMREIVTEKAGTLKPGSQVFAYDPEDALISQEDAAAARGVVIERCQELDLPLRFVGSKDYELLGYSGAGQKFYCPELNSVFSTKLLGIFQPINALLAAFALQDHVAAADIVQGIAQTIWPARLEVISEEPYVLLDGAHNPQGCMALENALGRLLDNRSLVFLSGMLRDKDYASMLDTVFNSKRYKTEAIVLADPPSPRKIGANELAAITRNVLKRAGTDSLPVLEAIPDPSQALQCALELAEQKNAVVCAFGSLYLAGEIRRAMRKIKR